MLTVSLTPLAMTKCPATLLLDTMFLNSPTTRARCELTPDLSRLVPGDGALLEIEQVRLTKQLKQAVVSIGIP